METASQEVKVLGQRPRKLQVAGRDLTLESPSLYRLQNVIEAFFVTFRATEVLKDPAFKNIFTIAGDITDEQDDLVKKKVLEFCKEFADKLVDLLSIICTSNNGAAAPDPFRLIEFWKEQVTVSEIVALLGEFIDMIDIGELLKNVRRLKGSL